MGLIFKLPLSWCTMTSANIITFSHHTTYSTQHSHDSKRWCPIIYFDEKVSLLVTFSANSSFGLLKNFLSSWFPFYFKLVNQKKYENGYVQNPTYYLVLLNTVHHRVKWMYTVTANPTWHFCVRRAMNEDHQNLLS